MDVKSAFLNGDLQEEVYIEQSTSFVVAGKEHKGAQAMEGIIWASSSATCI
jgi:hypothetical protein